ncbi:MAG: hypothetical protein EPO55_00655 [Reyranella sp.]|uniref:hypothetical protein n=1 Tax=Reyranella sp. TaxID=1929291 RepID=UPI001229682E|nr:hypothetical protein [Reyranella sp.]TAJ42771.1 MAG: hypothetical protein EPO55_00655 [Reyranella sp.]
MAKDDADLHEAKQLALELGVSDEELVRDLECLGLAKLLEQLRFAAAITKAFVRAAAEGKSWH